MSPISYILIKKVLPISGNFDTSDTQLIWTVPAWNPVITSGRFVSISKTPVNYQQSVIVPISSTDIITSTEPINDSYTELNFLVTSLKILIQPIPGTLPMIPSDWSLLVIPRSYLPQFIPQGIIVPLMIPSSEVTLVTKKVNNLGHLKDAQSVIVSDPPTQNNHGSPDTSNNDQFLNPTPESEVTFPFVQMDKTSSLNLIRSSKSHGIQPLVLE